MPVSNGLYFTISNNGAENHPPVVLIHGAGGSSLGWHSSIRRLPGYNVISLDLPGHGRSTGTGRQSILEYARDVIDFVFSLKLPGVVPAGHSMGGAIAMQAALLAPQWTRGLIVISSGASCSLPDELINSLSNPNLRNSAIDALCRRLISPLGDPKWVDQTRKALQDTRQGILFGDLFACTHYDLSGECPKISTPSLICSGRYDRFFPPQSSHQLAALIPSAREAMLEGGHLLPLENPQELVTLFQDFLGNIKK